MKMKKIIIMMGFVLLFSTSNLSASLNRISSCDGSFDPPSSQEKLLYELINEYRQSYGLPPIRLSKSLTHVARTHVRDLEAYPPSGSCNLHSWSEDGPWSSCCYTSDHAQASCMWDKPRESTPYSGKGYEVSTGPCTSCGPEAAIETWKSSHYHNAVILNQNNWSSYTWESIGVGIYEGYANVWFGEEEDPCGYWDGDEQDCAGVPGGSAYLDDCGNCVGGNTGLNPCTKPETSYSTDPNDLKPMLGATWEFTHDIHTDTLTFRTEITTNDDGNVTLVYYDQNLDFGAIMYGELPSDLELGERGFIAVTLEDMEEPKHAYIFTIAGDTATGYWIGEFTDPYPLTGTKLSDSSHAAPEDLEPMIGTTWEFTYNGQTDTLAFSSETSTNDDTVGLVYYDQNLDFGVIVYSELPSDLGLGEHGFVAATFDDMEEPKYAYAFTIAGDTATGYWSGEFTDPYPLTGRKISGGESVPDLSGLWVHEDWGEMSILQNGQQVNATFTKLSTWMIDDCGYKVGDQALYGTLTDQTITGKVYGLFCGTFRSRCPDQWIIWEDLTLTLSEDGNTLQGQWYNHTIHEDCSIADGGWEPFTLTRKTTITPETGHLVTPDLWIRAVIQTEDKGPIEAVWQQGGDDTMAGGARVIWGYFYASPDDVSWGSKENPDLFVKIWFDASGRTDVNFFHVSVPEIDVYSDYEYDGTADEHGITTMSRRYIRQWYENGLSHSDESYEDGIASPWYYPSGNPSGYPTVNNLRIGSVINTDGGPIDAVWYEGGNSLTAGGHEVLWGYFYASPNDVGWGSRNNPDLFVKVWFDASGRVDVNYFHVSVPDIEVYSDLPSDSSYDEKGTTILDDRYIRHEFWIASDTVRITGQVTGEDQQPLSGVKIKIPLEDGPVEVFSGQDGRYSLDVSDEDLPGTLAILAVREGFVPGSQNITKTGASEYIVDFVMEAIPDDTVILEIEPTVHHLGDDDYSGAINSQFQKRTEGLVYTEDFDVDSFHLGFSQAEISLFAKGLQSDNTLSVNGHQIAILDSAPADGSFGTVTFLFDTSLLSKGRNTLEIESFGDDFEFTNVVIRFKRYKDSCLRVSRKDSPEEQLFDFAFIDFSELAK
ncbi:MAG: hypothetical protein DRI57_06065 [Deltaproteobacteria bacterium]|nr:MAG: hypothetical protein DRI57_06065 [Deltaproteobacteria bacterium]